MKLLFLATAIGAGLAMPAGAAQPARDPDHDHRHGARIANAQPRADPPHMGLVEAARYISAQVPGELRHVEARSGASAYVVDVDLVNGARAGFEVDAHDGTVRWREIPAIRN